MKIFLPVVLIIMLLSCGRSQPQDQQKSQALEAIKQRERQAEETGFENNREGLEQLLAVHKAYDSLREQKALAGCELKIAELYRRAEKFEEARRMDSLALQKARAGEWHDLEADALMSLSLNWKTSDEVRAADILHEAEQLINTWQLTEKKATLWYEKGVLHTEYSRFNEAIIQFDSAIRFCRQSGNQVLLGRCYREAAMAEVFLTNYEKAMDYGLKAMAIQEKEDKYHDLASTYTVMALIYGCTHDVQKQRYYNRKGMEIMLRENRKNADLVSLYNNTAHSYAADFPDSSLYYYYEALKLIDTAGLESNRSSVYMNLGNLYLNRGVTDSASRYLFAAKRLVEGNQEQSYHLGSLYAHLSLLYEKTGEIDTAIWYINKGLEIYNSTASFGRGGSFNHLAYLYTRKGDYKKAYEYKTRYLEVKDSLFNSDVDRKMVRLSAIHEIEKKDAELTISEKNGQLLDQEVRAKQRRVLLLSVISALLLLLVGIVLYFLRQKSRNETELKSKNERIRNLMYEMTHRVKNNFQVLSNVFSLQANGESQGSGLIRENKARVDALLLLHQKLSVDDTLQKINPVEYINELSGYLILSYGFPESAVTREYAPNIPDIDVDRLMPLGLIVNEMVSNAMKHAYRGVAEPQLFIGLRMLDQDVCVLTIRDNGVAEPGSLEDKSGSLGMRLLHIFARQLQARLHHKISNGLEWTLEFNIHANFPTPNTHS